MGVENKHRIRLHNDISSDDNYTEVCKIGVFCAVRKCELHRREHRKTIFLLKSSTVHAACNERAPNELYHSVLSRGIKHTQQWFLKQVLSMMKFHQILIVINMASIMTIISGS